MTTPDITTRLREALKPFADLADYIDAERPAYAKRGMEVQIEGWPYTLSVAWLYEAREAMTSPAWQPIETAPKDGWKILATDRFHRERTWVVWWKGSEWVCDHHNSRVVGLTDWMPLPATPSQIEEGKDHG
ncbi:hypothetical protein [Novosphingobium sp. ZW T3_23]|uniref:hypothetical protein n=1 Tax=Novosphingobium sp. ZW T3_23 TaxID=3378084 RepID=UPI003852E5F9